MPDNKLSKYISPNKKKLQNPSFTGEEFSRLYNPDDAVRNWFIDYINSPKYKERLRKSGYTDPNQVIFERRNKIQNTKVVPQLDKDVGSAYMALDNKLFMDNDQVDDIGTSREDVLSHEFGHAINSAINAKLDANYNTVESPSNTSLSRDEEKYIAGKNKKVGAWRLLSAENSPRKDKETLSHILSDMDHDYSPYENKSDMDSFRYLLNKEGIYDAGTQDFTPELLEKAKKNKNVKKAFNPQRFLKHFSDKDIIDLMNGIAANNSNQQIPIAADGIKIGPGDPPTRGQEIKKKYNNPYVTGGREDWGDYLETKKLPFSGHSVKQAIYNAAKQSGLNPRLLYTSAMEEGLREGIDKPDMVSEAYLDAIGDGPKKTPQKFDPNEYPIDGFRTYGLDTFGNQYEALKSKGYLPKDFDKRFTTFDATNELNGKVKSAAFKTEDDALIAKAAMLRNTRDNLKNYAEKNGYKLTPKQEDFFNLVGYNAGEGNMQKMLKSYKDKGYLKDDNFLNDPNFKPASYAQPYTYAQRRLVNSDVLDKEGYFQDYGTDNSNAPQTAPIMRKGGLTSSKAKEILRDGTAQGHPLTEKQKKYFGYIAGGGTPKMEDGGNVQQVEPPKKRKYSLPKQDSQGISPLSYRDVPFLDTVFDLYDSFTAPTGADKLASAFAAIAPGVSSARMQDLVNTPTFKPAFDVLNLSNSQRQKLFQKYGMGYLDKWQKEGQPDIFAGGGLSRAKDYGSKKKPYPMVKKGDFAGGGRSYPIPTKADAVDALRLAGLHHRPDVKAKVYKKYPELKKAEFGEFIGDNPGDITAPKGYAPLSQQNRQDWNSFVRYLNRDLKVGGDKSLDDRSNARGLEYMKQYKKANPNFSITPEMVPYVQYEFQQLKNTNALPGVNPQGRVKTLVQDYFKDRQVSPIDSWIGSLTSRQGYPEISEFSDDPQKRQWGLDYEGASQFEAQNWNKRKEMGGFVNGLYEGNTLNEPKGNLHLRSLPMADHGLQIAGYDAGYFDDRSKGWNPNDIQAAKFGADLSTFGEGLVFGELPEGQHWPIVSEDGAFVENPLLYGELADYEHLPIFKSGGWIQKAINPKHKGYCTPMTKSTCTPRRKALARRFKSGDLSHKEFGGAVGFTTHLTPRSTQGYGTIPYAKEGGMPGMFPMNGGDWCTDCGKTGPNVRGYDHMPYMDLGGMLDPNTIAQIQKYIQQQQNNPNLATSATPPGAGQQIDLSQATNQLGKTFDDSNQWDQQNKDITLNNQPQNKPRTNKTIDLPIGDALSGITSGANILAQEFIAKPRRLANEMRMLRKVAQPVISGPSMGGYDDAALYKVGGTVVGNIYDGRGSVSPFKTNVDFEDSYKTTPNNANVLAESGEVVQLPNGSTDVITGDRHSDPSGGEFMRLPENSKIYSDSMKLDKDFASDLFGKKINKKMTVADAAKKFDTKPEDQVLQNKRSDIVAQRTANIMKTFKENQLQQLFDYQELTKNPAYQSPTEGMQVGKYGVRVMADGGPTPKKRVYNDAQELRDLGNMFSESVGLTPGIQPLVQPSVPNQVQPAPRIAPGSLWWRTNQGNIPQGSTYRSPGIPASTPAANIARQDNTGNRGNRRVGTPTTRRVPNPPITGIPDLEPIRGRVANDPFIDVSINPPMTVRPVGPPPVTTQTGNQPPDNTITPKTSGNPRTNILSGIGEIAPELFALGQNLNDFPIWTDKYQPRYITPQQLQIQDNLNRNYAATQTALQSTGNPALDSARQAQALANLYDANNQAFQQKANYDANARFQADQFNLQTENEANRYNLQRADDFWNKATARQAVKEATNNNIVNSAYQKFKRKQFEDRQLQLANQMFQNYRYDPRQGIQFDPESARGLFHVPTGQFIPQGSVSGDNRETTTTVREDNKGKITRTTRNKEKKGY